MENSPRSALTVILNTFFICIVVYFIEYKFFYVRTVTIFGTTIINKLFAIVAVFLILRYLKTSWKSIGYVVKSKKIISGIITPLVILGVCAVVSFIFIKLLVESQGASLDIKYYISASSLDPHGANSPSIISVIINVFSVLITSIMLETLLRGFVLQTANKYFRFYAANTINVILTIVWHSIIYIFRITFGNMDVSVFIMSLLYTAIIYSTAAVRKSLYIRSSGAIWACLVDCFLSLLIIHNLPITITLPTDFAVTNPIGYLVSFMSTRASNSSYATIAFICMVNVLSLIVMIVYCSILKKKARKKYIKRLSRNNATENN